MRLLSCPKKDSLFELVSIPTELSVWKKLPLKMHTMTCESCRKTMTTLESTWAAYFTPPPDITSSIMNVYSRLQTDETLILKGWKLDERKSAQSQGLLALGNWAMRGGFVAGVMALLVMLLLPRMKPADKKPDNLWAAGKIPPVQIRFEDKNRVKVQYVQPELLQSIEFETTSAGR